MFWNILLIPLLFISRKKLQNSLPRIIKQTAVLRSCWRQYGFVHIIPPILLLGFIIACGAGLDTSNNESRVPSGFPPCKSPGVTIYGIAYYEDRIYDRLGFTGERQWKTANHADLEVIRDISDPTNTDIIGVGATNGEGKYCITIINPGHSEGVKIRVSASTQNTPEGILDPLPGMSLKVVDTNLRLYSFLSGNIDDRLSDIIRVDIYARAFITDLETENISQGVGGVFNILDNMAKGYKSIWELSGKQMGQLPPLTIKWKSQQQFQIKLGTFGSFYDSRFNLISVNGGDAYDSGDHDEYDDDIILHEFGHYAVDKIWHDDSPGGQHFINGFKQDMRLAWSEGWASFFSSAIRNNPLIVDTVGGDPEADGTGGGALFSYDIETFQFTHLKGEVFFNGKYDTSELTISGVLWDIFDSVTEDHDNISTGLGLITNAQYFFKEESGKAKKGITLEKFWDGWLVNNEGTGKEELIEILKNSDINYFKDEYEDDNTPETLRLSLINRPEEDHSLYPARDEDYLLFEFRAGIKYTIRTFNLINGIDTKIFLFDDQLTLLASNDNHSGINYTNCVPTYFTSGLYCPENGNYVITEAMADLGIQEGDGPLSSKITFTPEKNGQYIVKVTGSPERPVSAGDYGSYDIVVYD